MVYVLIGLLAVGRTVLAYEEQDSILGNGPVTRTGIVSILPLLTSCFLKMWAWPFIPRLCK